MTEYDALANLSRCSRAVNRALAKYGTARAELDAAIADYAKARKLDPLVSAVPTLAIVADGGASA